MKTGAATAEQLAPGVYSALPASICSWNFIVSGPELTASTRHNWASESGALVINGRPLEIRSRGWLSGAWDLLDEQTVIASGVKPNALFRRFEITGGGGAALLLAASSAFGRSHHLSSSGSRIAVIDPVHPFTSRSTISVVTPVAGELLVFAFWLAVLMWKRASESSSDASSD